MSTTLHVRDGIARLALDRPEAGNAIDPALAASLRAHAAQLRDRDDVRVVVLSSGGRAFCVGGDVGFFAGAADPGAAIGALAGDLHAALLDLAELEAPVLARVHGAAAGAGLSLVLAADLAVGAPGATFTVAYAGVGLSPDGGSSWLLPRLVGQRRAAELMLTNRRVAATEAATIGLLTEVVEDDRLDARVEALATALAAGPLGTHAAIKRLLRTSATAGFPDQLDRERVEIAARAASAEGREGIAAFVAKRRPDFRGAR